jgi:methylsterol monooxygenase/4,4-dimethyl-9beta,19-cyclopropylsterol-4alpha-methyl oxidase
VIQLILYSSVQDYLSYWVHRFLHTKWAYEKIHCVHHEMRTPTSFAASHAHGIELIMYVICDFAGPAIVPCHITTHWLWFSIRLNVAMDAHSG